MGYVYRYAKALHMYIYVIENGKREMTFVVGKQHKDTSSLGKAYIRPNREDN